MFCDIKGKQVNNSRIFVEFDEIRNSDPQKIPDDLLQNLTGLGKGNFGDYVAKLANAGIKKDSKTKRILNLEQMALLERTKIRQNIDDRVLCLIFNIGLSTTYYYFWQVQLMRFANTDHYAKVGTVSFEQFKP